MEYDLDNKKCTSLILLIYIFSNLSGSKLHYIFFNICISATFISTELIKVKVDIICNVIPRYDLLNESIRSVKLSHC